MKKLILISLSLITFAAYSQKTRPKTLIGNDPEDISGFGSVLFSFSAIDGELSTLTGGGGAVLFDNTFFIGGYGLGMTGNSEFQLNGENYSSSYNHGGFWIGYNLKPDELIHFGIDTKLGWGTITTKSSSLAGGRDEDAVFVFQPQFFVESNISYWFKINAGLGFQKTIGVDDTYYDTGDFDSPAFSISLLFGWFN